MYKLALDLAKAFDMNITAPNTNQLLQLFVIIEEHTQDLEVSTGIKLNSEPKNNSDDFFEIDREISDTISQTSKCITNTTDDILNFQILRMKVLIIKHKLFQL